MSCAREAMVLAAGFGRRLEPLTLRLPKPAIPVLGRPIIEQVLHGLAGHGVDSAVINLHHHAEVLQSMLGNGCPAFPCLNFSHESELAGTAGALRVARDLFCADGPLIVLNGDFLADIDYAALLEHHRATGALATLVTMEPREGYRTIDVDDAGLVRRLAGLPEPPVGLALQPRLFTGCHVIERELLDCIPEDLPSDFVRDLYRPIAAAGRLASFAHDGFWYEFGSPRLLLDGSLALLARSQAAGRRLTAHDPLREVDEAIVAVGPGARMHDGARLAGRVSLGLACELGADTRVEESIVMPESWIGPGARLRRVIVSAGLEVPRDTVAENVVLWADAGGTCRQRRIEVDAASGAR